jgi:transcriptional regulator with XRE-family HTH domain
MIGERIRAARKAQGLSLRALAERVGLSHEMIRRYEQGKAVPSASTLHKIADTLRCSPDYFLRPTLVGAIEPAFRLKRTLPARERAMIILQVRDWIERYLIIERILGLETRFEFPEGFPYPVRQMEDVEQAAIALRDAWQVGLAPIANLVALLEERGLRVGTLSGSKCSTDAPSKWRLATTASPFSYTPRTAPAIGNASALPTGWGISCCV